MGQSLRKAGGIYKWDKLELHGVCLHIIHLFWSAEWHCMAWVMATQDTTASVHSWMRYNCKRLLDRVPLGHPDHIALNKPDHGRQ